MVGTLLTQVAVVCPASVPLSGNRTALFLLWSPLPLLFVHAWREADCTSQLQERAYEQTLVNEILYAPAHSDWYGRACCEVASEGQTLDFSGTIGKEVAAFSCDRKVVVCESGISGGRHVGNARTRVRDEGNVLMTLSSSWI